MSQNMTLKSLATKYILLANSRSGTKE